MKAKNKCVAVILAGGKSARMGHPKGLLDFFGTYWLLEQLKRLKLAGIRTIYIGLGYDAEAYFNAIPILKEAQKTGTVWLGMKLKVSVNATPELGSFSTLQMILNEVSSFEKLLIIPIDVPLLNQQELRALLKQKEQLVKPQFQKQSGHPILIKGEVVGDLLKLPKLARLDEFIKSNTKYTLKYWDCLDPQVILNINTLEIWNNYKSQSLAVTG